MSISHLVYSSHQPAARHTCAQPECVLLVSLACPPHEAQLLVSAGTCGQSLWSLRRSRSCTSQGAGTLCWMPCWTSRWCPTTPTWLAKQGPEPSSLQAPTWAASPATYARQLSSPSWPRHAPAACRLESAPWKGPGSVQSAGWHAPSRAHAVRHAPDRPYAGVHESGQQVHHWSLLKA